MTQPSINDDHQLLERYLQKGDATALARLIDRHLPLVYAVALRITRQPQLAEEVGQDVFLKLIRKPPAPMNGISLAAWLHRVARCKAIDVVRSEESRVTRERESGLHDESPEPALTEEALRLLDEVIDTLPEAERRLVIGRFFLGRSFAALSGETGAREDAVRMRLSRILEKMRQSFSRRGIATTAAILAQALPLHSAVAPPRTLNLSILKAAGSSGGAASASLFTIIQLMTTTKKCLIAGAVLLAAAVPVAIHLTHPADQPSRLSTDGKDAGTAAVTVPDNPSSTQRSSARTLRKPTDGELAALVTKYGEEETRQARALASQSVVLLRDMAASAKVAEMSDAQEGAKISRLSEVLKLTPEQAEFADSLRSEVSTLRHKQIQELSTRLDQNIPALSELFLTVDARSRGKVDEDAYREVVRNRTEAISVGSTHAWDFLAMVGMQGVFKAEDPFVDMPEAAEAFAAKLDPDRRREYEEIRAAGAEAEKSGPSIDLKDLDALGNNVAGMKKMIEAMELVSPSEMKK